ncbi:MAG: helix-turn-helix domain-containing protein [Streptosporangiaceae bacterium]
MGAVVARWSGREAKALREAKRMSLRDYAAHLGVSEVALSNLENKGERARLRYETQQLLDADLAQAGNDAQQRFALLLSSGGGDWARSTQHVTPAGEMWGRSGTLDSPRQAERLRQRLNDALSDGSMTGTSLEEWRRTLLRYGPATRDRPAAAFLDEFTVDLVELGQLLQRRRSAATLRQLTRLVARMSGLMCLTFCKLDDRPASRRWARTARLAANEAGDPQTRSWVLAQEAYGHYYGGDLREAVDVAQHAQGVVPATPCVGAALAAALEARANAAMGRRRETHAALARAEEVTAQLDGDALVPSAFGYNEAQLRFHAGSAYTHLRELRAAFIAQDRALQLCMPGDYTDWAMTRLDRASCLAYSGDTADALNRTCGLKYASETIIALSESQRRGIIALRGHELLNGLSTAQRRLPAARDLHEALMMTTDRKEVWA